MPTPGLAMSRARCVPLLIAGLGLLFFADLVWHPAQMLYSDYSDLVALHVPARHFLVQSWQETGELPRWCPYRYAGTPFIHDIQVAAFYPPHYALLLLRPGWMGAALSWLIVFHVILAGWCMYAYARSQGLGTAGSLVAALGFMFAGKWLLHILGGGHYVCVGLAWLPLVLLCLERAIRRGSLLWATGSGVVYSLVVLSTQPQWTFYAGLFIALWTLAPALEEAGFLDGGGPRSTGRTRKALGRWVGFGAWTVLVAAGLAAVQLLPTAEGVTQSVRAGGVEGGFDWSGARLSLLSLFGPTLINTPPQLAWEERGGLVVLWAAAAAMAPLLGSARTRYQAAVCLALLLFAPVAALGLQHLPGFNLFRQPTRMLVVAGLPVAFLAGVATDRLLSSPGLTPEGRRRCRQVLAITLLVAAVLTGGLVLLIRSADKPLSFHPYWLTLLATVPAVFWLLGSQALGKKAGRVAWVVLLLVDLWGLVWPLVHVRHEAQVYAPSACVRAVAGQGRVLDRPPADSTTTPLGTGAPLAMLLRIEAIRGYTPLDVFRFKEYLQWVGNSDQPLRAFEGPLTHPIMGDFPVENKPLLNLLGVRYLMQPAGRPLTQPGWEKVEVDPHPRAYDLIAGGVQELPPYTLYRNPDAFPRAFVVPEAAPPPDRSERLAALKDNDYRRRVFLENAPPQPSSSTPEGAFRPATIRENSPNRVVVTTDEGPAGYLVLADVWFPGWTATLDGRPVPVDRGDFLFRAVTLPAGAHEVVFAFDPASYRLGKLVSLGTLTGAFLLCLLLCLWRWSRRPAPSPLSPETSGAEGEGFATRS